MLIIWINRSYLSSIISYFSYVISFHIVLSYMDRIVSCKEVSFMCNENIFDSFISQLIIDIVCLFLNRYPTVSSPRGKVQLFHLAFFDQHTKSSYNVSKINCPYNVMITCLWWCKIQPVYIFHKSTSYTPEIMLVLLKFFLSVLKYGMHFPNLSDLFAFYNSAW